MRTAIVAAILAMIGSRATVYRERAAAFAFHAERAIAAEESKRDPALLSAVAGRESAWRWTRGGKILTGKAGEIGFMQIHPKGRALAACTDLDIYKPVENIRCGLRLLALAEHDCGGAPANWLGGYQGQKHCGPSDYSARVLAWYEKAKRTKVLADVVPLP